MPEAETWNFADAQAEFTPSKQTVWVCFDGSLAHEVDRLEAELADFDGPEPEATALARRIIEAHDELRDKARPFVMCAIGDRWRDLVDASPPSEEQAAMGLGYNPEALPQRAIAACCTNPTVSAEQAEWMFSNLAVGQWTRLWRACLDLNVVGEDGVGKAPSGTARLLATAQNLITAAPVESPGLSSPAGE